jgi:hypothetical protein
MHVSVRVRFPEEIRFSVLVSMVVVVNVRMLVLEQLVHMPVGVDLGEKKRNAERHVRIR